MDEIMYICSSHRDTYPGGETHRFVVPDLGGNVLPSIGSFRIAVKKVILPKNYKNVRTGINDKIVFKWLTVPTGYAAATADYTLTLAQGYYDATTFATAMNTAVADSIAAQTDWVSGGRTAPSFTITYDSTMGGFKFVGSHATNLVFELCLTEELNEPSKGTPAKKATERLALQLGLENFYYPFYARGVPLATASTRASNNTYNLTSQRNFNPAFSQEVLLTGSLYIDVLTDLNTAGSLSTNRFRGLLCRVPCSHVNPGDVIVYEPTVINRGISTTGYDLHSLSFELRDEDGLPYNLDGAREMSIEIQITPEQAN